MGSTSFYCIRTQEHLQTNTITMPQPTIPKTQKAIVSDSADKGIEVREIPVIQQKDLETGTALVKILYTGICHTDLHVVQDDWPLKASRPCIAGHEGAGEIVALANNTQTKFKIGDRVGVKWIATSCNECQFCLAGDEPLCPHLQCSGLTVQGTFRQYTPAHLSQLSPIPDKLPLEQAAPILCAGLTVYKALKETGAKAGQYVALPGAGGGLGSLALQYARYMGLSPIRLTPVPRRRLCARSSDVLLSSTLRRPRTSSRASRTLLLTALDLTLALLHPPSLMATSKLLTTFVLAAFALLSACLPPALWSRPMSSSLSCSKRLSRAPTSATVWTLSRPCKLLPTVTSRAPWSFNPLPPAGRCLRRWRKEL